MSYQSTEAVLTSDDAVRGTELVVLVILSTHAHKDGTSAFPSVGTMSRQARVSVRSVQYALRRLERKGLIVATARADGGRGRPTVYSITVRKGATMPLADKGANAERVQSSAERVQPVAHEPSQNHPFVSSSSETYGGSRGERAQKGGAIGDPTRPPTPRELARMTRDFQDLAAATWEAEARKCGNPYIDPQALKRVKFLAVDALSQEDEETILAGIRAGMDQKSSPIRIREWALDEGGRRRELEHVARRREERQRLDAAAAANPATFEQIQAQGRALGINIERLPDPRKIRAAGLAADEAVFNSHKQRGRARCACAVCVTVRERFGHEVRAS